MIRFLACCLTAAVKSKSRLVAENLCLRQQDVHLLPAVVATVSARTAVQVIASSTRIRYKIQIDEPMTSAVNPTTTESNSSSAAKAAGDVP